MGAAGNTAQLSKNDGVTAYSTIIAISESPVARGVVWAGTDDGNLQVSRDNGATFTEVGKNITGLPAGALTATTRTGSRASTRRTSTRPRRTSRSTDTAATTSSRTSSSRATTDARGRT